MGREQKRLSLLVIGLHCLTLFQTKAMNLTVVSADTLQIHSLLAEAISLAHYPDEIIPQPTEEDTTRIKTLLKSAERNIRKPGELLSDMDSAAWFIQQAENLCVHPGLKPWLLQCHYWRGLICLEKKQWDDARKIMLPLADEYKKSNDLHAQANVLDSYGSYLPGLAILLDEKFEILTSAGALYSSLKDTNREFRVLRLAEEVHILQGKLSLAEESLLKLAKRAEQENYNRIYKIYLQLSSIHQTKGNLNTALQFGQAALKSMENSEAKDNEYPVLMDLARLYYAIGNDSTALIYHRRAFEICKVVFPNYVHLYFNQLVLGMIKQGQVRQAFELAKDAKLKFTNGGRIEEQSFDLCLGMCYETLKNYELADRYYQSVLQSEVTYMEMVFPVYHTIGQYYINQKQFRKARPVVLNLLNQREDVLIASEKSIAHQMLYQIDTTLGNYKSAVKHLEIHKQLSDSVFDVAKTRQLHELHLQYETEKKDNNIQLLTQQGELQQAKLDQSQFVSTITIAGAALLLFIAGLLYFLYTTKQKSNKQLTHLLHEKEWLLKEIHHRVKNNLQTVLSLLESQSRQLSNEAFDALQESQNRVYAMSLIHKKLYQSLDVSSINMEDYLRDLIQHLRDSFGSSANIRFSLELDQIELDVSQAVPVGLIVNEAITNAIKYAFPKRQYDNEITISFKKGNSNKVVLLIADNGTGITTQIENTQSLGLKLIRGLTEDIEGTFSIKSAHGVMIMIEFVANMPFQKITETTSSARMLQPA